MNHYKTTLNYFDNRSTNASAESVNSNSLNPLNDPGEDGATLSPTNLNAQDVFGYSLHYFDHDFSGAIGGNNNFIANQANSTLSQNSSQLYNGNIGCMVTTIINPNTREILPLGNAYRYDQLNRLSSAVSFKNLDLQSNSWQTGGAPSFANSFNYDANGNILKQIRKDEANNEIDNLTYHYETFLGSTEQRNRLAYVEDASSNSDINELSNQLVGNYQYDFEGRLILDKIEEIDQIYWRVDGKVKKIKRTANSPKKNITFDYDAMGNRIAKHVYTSNDIWEKSTYYVLDAQGNLLSTYVYENNNTQQILQIAQTEKVIYGSSRLGTNFNPIPLFASQNSTQPVLFITHNIGLSTYELTNHLGNVLSVISDKPIPHQNGQTVDYWQAEVRQATDYSPFGVQLQTRNLFLTVLGNEGYRYGYQGQEMDNEVKDGGNSYTTFFRQLDPRLGRWLSIDPKALATPWESPYVSMGNNPIWRNDIYGDVFDEKSQVVLNDHKANTNKLLDKAKARESFLNASETSLTKVQKIELESVRNSIKEFENSLSEIAEMEESSQEFNLKIITETDPRYRKGVRGNTSNLDGKVLIEYSSTSTLAHELKHGSQFIRGDLGFDKTTNQGGFLHDADDEQQAYQREIAYVNYSKFKIYTADDIRARDDNYKALMNGPLGVESTIEQVFRGRSPEYNTWLDSLTPELRASKFKSSAEALEEIIFIGK